MSSRNRIITFLLFVGAVLLSPGLARAAESIPHIDVHARLETSRLFNVEERITYDFGPADRHGIFRYIPLVQIKDGYRSSLRFVADNVERDGRSEPYTLSTPNDNWTVKIGSPRQLVTGAHDYVLRYHTDRVLRFFPDHDELYWNVTGNGWEVGINEATFTLDLPPGVQPKDVICFTGPTGSTEQACEHTVASSTVTVRATRPLAASEGLTVAVSFPKGIFTPPTSAETMWMTIQDDGIVAIPILTLILMGFLWFRYGRDPETPTVVPQYDPPGNLSPGVIDSIFHDESISSKGMTATLLDLARREHLHIRFETKERLIGSDRLLFTFLRHASKEAILPTEQKVIDAIFAEGDEVPTTQLSRSSTFHAAVQKWQLGIQEEVKRMNVFDVRPGTIRPLSMVAAIAAAFGVFFVGGPTPLSIVSAVLTAFIIVGIGWFMPRRSEKGAALYSQILGFRWFLSVTEKDRMAFHQAPERKPEEFYRLLPYAIVLGVEKAWAEQFASFVLKPPSWAEGNVSFTSVSYVSSVQTFHSAAASTYSDASSSGFSGGSSGGGSGGGGGGSW